MVSRFFFRRRHELLANLISPSALAPPQVSLSTVHAGRVQTSRGLAQDRGGVSAYDLYYSDSEYGSEYGEGYDADLLMDEEMAYMFAHGLL